MNATNHKTWFHKHPVCTWAIISIAFAFVIHILFSLSTSHAFFVAKWSAGELLAYSSTVAIGLLAFWQNKRIMEENEAAQQRLERLSEQANTLSITSKIVEIEYENLTRLKTALDEFSTACDPIEISAHFANSLSKNDHRLRAIAVLGEQEKRIDDSFFSLARELRIDPKIKESSSEKIIEITFAFYKAAKTVVGELRNDPEKGGSASDATALAEAKERFYEERECFLMRKEKMLNEVIYGDLTLEEIKKTYRQEYMSQEDAHNG